MNDTTTLAAQQQVRNAHRFDTIYLGLRNKVDALWKLREDAANNGDQDAAEDYGWLANQIAEAMSLAEHRYLEAGQA